MPQEVISIGEDAIVVMQSAEQRPDTSQGDERRPGASTGRRTTEAPASSYETMRGNDPGAMPPPLT